MSAPPNDRQIVEMMVLPAALNAVISVMRKRLAEDSGSSLELDRAHALLAQALAEPVSGLTPDRTAKLTRRAKRVTVEALRPIFETQQLAAQYLTLAYLIAELAAEDVIRVGAASPFSEAWDIMCEVMGAVSDCLPELEAIASRESDALRRRLAALGYFA